jgi:hypothetical protein
MGKCAGTGTTSWKDSKTWNPANGARNDPTYEVLAQATDSDSGRYRRSGRCFIARISLPQLAGTDYCEYCINQAAKPVSQIVIFVSHLVVPEVYRQANLLGMVDWTWQYILWSIR